MIGFSSGCCVNSGNTNTIIGFNAYQNGTFSTSNTVVGALSGRNACGSQNVFVGSESGCNSLSSNNTFIGWRSGSTLVTGDRNTFVGSLTTGTGSNSIVLGVCAQSTASNQLVIGSSVYPVGPIQTGTFSFGSLGVGSNVTYLNARINGSSYKIAISI